MLAFRLAESQSCTVAELGERMDSAEFTRWAAYDALSPIGGIRHDYLAAMLATLLANLWSKKRHKLKEFLPAWGKDKRRGSSPEQIMAYFTSLKAAQDREEAKRGN